MSQSNHTTIWVSRETHRKLKRVQRPNETYDEVINRLFQGEGNVFVQFWSIDGTPAIEHEVVFQLGKYYYLYKEGEFTPIRPNSLQVKYETQEVEQ